MFTKEQIISKLESFINSKIDDLSISNSLVMVFRPIIHRASKKVICKIDKLLDYVADEKGMIDIEAILTEMANNLVTASNKSYPDMFEGLNVGNGKITIDIPFINKELVFTKEDIEDLKSYLIR